MVSRHAIFFDLDGTLFDTRGDLAATVNHTRRDLGLPEWPVADVVKNVGQGARYLLAHSIPESDRPFEELWPVFRSHYAEHCCESLTPYPGVAETLEALRCAGWRLGVNTNKPNFATHAILEKFGFSRFFGPAVVAGGDLPEMKPAAAPLVRCAELAGAPLSPADWMVGDSWTDLACAANAGVGAVFCTFGFGFRRDYAATATVGRFSEIPEVVKEDICLTGR